MFALQKLSNKIPLLPFFVQAEWSLKSEYAAAVFENDDNDNDVCCFVTIKRYRDCFCLLMAWHGGEYFSKEKPEKSLNNIKT